MALPGMRFSASSTTSASVLSIRIGRGHAGRDFFQDRGDVALLVFAYDGAAQVEHVRAFVGELFRQRQNVVVFFGLHQLAEMIDARGRVHFFRYDQRLWLQIERH